MNDKLLSVAAIFLASMLFFSPLSLLTASPSDIDQASLVDGSLSAPLEGGPQKVKVENDTDLQTQALSNLWPGTGTASDPYLVQGSTLQGDDSSPAIWVCNTTLALRFLDIQVQDMREEGSPPLMVIKNVTGLELDRVHAYQEFENDSLDIEASRDVSVVNCTLGNTYISQCEDITIHNCTIGPCDGLYTVQNSDMTISDSTFDSTCVFDMYESDGVVLLNNTMLNIMCGVRLIHMGNVTCWSNAFLNCSLCNYPLSYRDDQGSFRYLVAPSNNTVNGAPLVLLRDIDMLGEVPAGAGQLILYNVTGASISDYDIQRCTNPISATLCNGLVITSVRLQWAYFGMNLYGCDGLEVRSCDLAHCLYGMTISASSSVLVQENTLNGTYYEDISMMTGAGDCGILMYNGDGRAIDNAISSYYSALVINELPHAEVMNNTIVYAEYGIRSLSSNMAIISGNHIAGAKYGINSETNRDLLMINNTLVRGKYGCSLSESDRCQVLGNNISECERYGICLFMGSDMNLIADNSLMSNNGAGGQFSSSAVQAYDRGAGNRWNSSSGGNTWYDWQGPDADRDGFVDSPYPIDGTSHSYDRLPLVSHAVADDRTPPTLAITSPAQGTWSSEHSLLVTWESEDNDTMVVKHWLSYDGSEWWDVGMASSSELDGVDGWHTLSVKAIDLAGNFAVRNVTFGFDRTAPDVGIADLAECYCSSSVTIEWNASDAGVGLLRVEVQVDGGEWLNATGNDSAVLSGLCEGYHEVTVKATDWLGWNSSAIGWFEVFLGIRELQITAPSEGAIFSGDVHVAWEVQGLSLPYWVWIVVDDQDPLSATGYDHTLTGLSDGRHSIEVRAEDDHGHSISDQVNMTVDRLAPVIAITSPAAGTFLDQGSVVLTWSVSDTTPTIVRWRVDGGGWTEVEGNSASVTGLAEGPHVLEISATDVLMHSSTAYAEFTVDLSAPIVDIVSPGEGALLGDSDVTVIWAVSDTTAVTSRWCVDGGAWTQVFGERVTVSPGDGHHVFLLSCRDQVGRVSSTSISFYIDNTAPMVTITSPAEGAIISSVEVNVTWTSDDLSDTFCRWRLDGGDWTSISGNGAALSGLDDGAHIFELLCIDAADNSANASVRFVIDTTAPSAEVSQSGDVRSSHWTVTITPSENLSVFELSVNGEDVGAFLSNGSLIVEMDSPLDGNELWLTLNCTDLAGNSASFGWNRSFDPVLPWVSGVLLDEDGLPLSDAEVHLDDAEIAITDTQGRFNVTAAPGSHSLTFVKEGYQDLNRSFTLDDGMVLQGLTMVPLEQDEHDDRDDSSDEAVLIIVAAVVVAAALATALLIRARRK